VTINSFHAVVLDARDTFCIRTLARPTELTLSPHAAVLLAVEINNISGAGILAYHQLEGGKLYGMKIHIDNSLDGTTVKVK